MERLIRRIESKKIKGRWTQLKYNGFSKKVDKLESQYNKAVKEMSKGFTCFGSILQEFGIWVMYSEVTKLKKHFSDATSTNGTRHIDF